MVEDKTTPGGQNSEEQEDVTVSSETPSEFEKRVKNYYQDQMDALECRMKELETFIMLLNSFTKERGNSVTLYPEEYMPEDAWQNVMPVRVESHLQSLGDHFEKLVSHPTTVDVDITVADNGVYYVETQHEIGKGCK